MPSDIKGEPKGGRRVALVVGVQEYDSPNIRSLDTPVDDAIAVAEQLSTLGFELQQSIDNRGWLANPTINQLSNAQYEFLKKASNADIALFYFAGHGVQFGDQNYLLLSNTEATAQWQVEQRSLQLSRLVKEMQNRAQATIALVDACRNNPFNNPIELTPTGDGERAVTMPMTGLAKPNIPSVTQKTTYVAFATTPGRTASDRFQPKAITDATMRASILADIGEFANHSPFTAALLKHLPRPGKTLSGVFDSVTISVIRWTTGKQQPEYFGSPAEEIFLALPDPGAEPRPLEPPAAASRDIPVVAPISQTRPRDAAPDDASPSYAQEDSSEAEAGRRRPSVAEVDWNDISTSTNPADFRKHYDAFPYSPHSDAALFKWADLIDQPAAWEEAKKLLSGSPLYREASNRFNKAVEEADNAAVEWAAAKAHGGVRVLKAFIDNHPRALQVQEAARMLAAVEEDTEPKQEKKSFFWRLLRAFILYPSILILALVSLIIFLSDKRPAPSLRMASAVELVSQIGKSTEADATIGSAIKASSPEERGRLLSALVAAGQFSLRNVLAFQSTPTPSPGCQLLAFRPEIDTAALEVCSGLDMVGQKSLVKILAGISSEVWSRSHPAEPLYAFRLIVDLMTYGPRWTTDPFTKSDTELLKQIAKNTSYGVDRPDNGVTLQFSGAVQRANAQAIMDKLVAVGWKLSGVERKDAATGLNEVRYGSSRPPGDAAKLASDLVTFGLSVPPKPNAVIGAKADLDIYISSGLALWDAAQHDIAWCFQRRGKDGRYSVRCHESRPACETWADPARADPDRAAIGPCLLMPSLSDAGMRAEWSASGGPKLGNGGAIFEYRNAPFPDPFPQLPAS